MKSHKTKLHYFLALLNATNLIFKFGTNLLQLFPEIEELFSAPTDFLIKCGLSQQEVIKLKDPNWQLVEQDLNWVEQPGNNIIMFDDPNYPQLLKEIPRPPLLLFITGDPAVLSLSQLAIVGSRVPTPIGSEIAYCFAKELAKSGVVITSGFATGIDAASHRGAISGLGKTIAVMGTGLKHLYPRNHAELAKQIVESGGALVSEFSLSAKGSVWHFPLRNRIISGLSFGTLVVEATLRSGSLITARLAGEQGREIFAIPGSIGSPLSRGCHALIRQGAKLVEQPADILEELGTSSIDQSWCKKNKLDKEYHKLLDCIGFEITPVDVLVARSNLAVQQINTMLLELELQGLIKSEAGGYIRTQL